METTTDFTIRASAARALPFAGTQEQANANYDTHAFDHEYDRCMYCDCRPWGVWAQYPCGNGDRVESQRIVYADGSEGTRIVKIINGEIVASRMATPDDDPLDFSI